ncbi:hypothetical protein pipiens_000770, partial [Culex pipiens pipiens]
SIKVSTPRKHRESIAFDLDYLSLSNQCRETSKKNLLAKVFLLGSSRPQLWRTPRYRRPLARVGLRASRYTCALPTEPRSFDAVSHASWPLIKVSTPRKHRESIAFDLDYLSLSNQCRETSKKNLLAKVFLLGSSRPQLWRTPRYRRPLARVGLRASRYTCALPTEPRSFDAVSHASWPL